MHDYVTNTTLHLQNGFNPIWETCTEFRLVYPELSFIEFQVKTLKEDSKSSDDPVIGGCIVPYILLQQECIPFPSHYVT